MAIDFPNTPTFGQAYTVGHNTWTYNGTFWESTTSTPRSDVLTATGDMPYSSAALTPAPMVKGTTGYPVVAGATIPGYAQLGTVGIADGAVTPAKTAPTFAKITRTYGGSVGNNTLVDVTWTADVSDADGWWSSGAYLTVPSGCAGVYAINANVYTGYAIVHSYLYINNSVVYHGQSHGNTGVVKYLAVGDTIKAAVLHQGPGSTGYGGDCWVVRLMS